MFEDHDGKNSADYYRSWDMKHSENEITANMKWLTFARRLQRQRCWCS